jgi:O-antigen/teichoic acid export membrane protein
MIPFDDAGAFHPSAGTHELRRLAVRGAAASITAAALALGAQVISTVLLARLLTPADFGVVTMATTFSLLLASFGLNGFTEAVIQFDEIDHQTASNLFWLNSGAGLVLAIAFAASGTLLARFYGNPLVAKVAVGLSVGIFIALISVIHLALLKRAMHFTGTSTNDLVGRALNTVVAIIFALRGWGYWSLVAGIVAQQLSVTVGALWMCRWLPSLPQWNHKTSAMVRFAAKVYGQFTVAYTTLNVDNVLVGWRFNGVAIGLYKKAFDLFALSASQLTAPLSNVALSALSRLKGDDARFRRSLTTSLGMIAFIGMAMSADMTLVGKDLVRLVLGPKWAEAGRIFELFAPGIGVMLLCHTLGWFHLSIGKPERWLRWTLFQLVTTFSMFLVALRWGPEGVAAAWSISFWMLLIPGFWYAGRPVGFAVSDLLGAISRYAVAALAAGLVTAWIVGNVPFLWDSVSGTGTAAKATVAISALFLGLYLGAVILLYWGLSPLRQLAGILRELAPARNNAKPEVEVVGA